MGDWMGRFSGGTPSRWESRSEINVRALAAATAPITNSPCHQDRDSFGTISRIDIMGSETRGQTLLVWDLPDAHRVKMRRGPCTEKFPNPTRMPGASHR